MSRRGNIYRGSVDKPEGKTVFSILHSTNDFGFFTIPLAVFSKKDQAILDDRTNIEVYNVGKRVKAKVIP